MKKPGEISTPVSSEAEGDWRPVTAVDPPVGSVALVRRSGSPVAKLALRRESDRPETEWILQEGSRGVLSWRPEEFCL